MTFTPAITEQLFVLTHVGGLAVGGSQDLAVMVMPDIIDAVLTGAGAFAAGSWAELTRPGHDVAPRLEAKGVTMPSGFATAYQAYVQSGWGGVAVPEEFGGQGLPSALAAAVLETLASADMGLALAPMLTMGAVEALTHHGSPDQQALYLPHLTTGAWTGTMNLTEPQAGSDVGALQTLATPRGDGSWSVKGTKIFISFGDHNMAANIVHLVLARTPGAQVGTKGISLFLVPKYRLDSEGQPGEDNDVNVVSIEHKLGLHASPTCVLSFGELNNCVGHLVGEEGSGMRAMFTMMNNARLNVGVQGVGLAERATQRAIAFAQDRVQSARAGMPVRSPVAIIDHPDVRRMLLRMKAQTQAARALVYYAMSMLDRIKQGEGAMRDRLDLLTPLAKAHATDLANEVASLGIQVHGGMGYIEETGAAQDFRDARILPIYEGTNGIQAADLVQRKLSGDARALLILLAEMRHDAEHEDLRKLINDCEQVTGHFLHAEIDDRLAGSYPFLTMCSVAVCGWLMERQGRAALKAGGDTPFLAMKAVVTRFYVEQIVPEASGLKAAALASAKILYSLNHEELAA